MGNIDVNNYGLHCQWGFIPKVFPPFNDGREYTGLGQQGHEKMDPISL